MFAALSKTKRGNDLHDINEVDISLHLLLQSFIFYFQRLNVKLYIYIYTYLIDQLLKH